MASTLELHSERTRTPLRPAYTVSTWNRTSIARFLLRILLSCIASAPILGCVVPADVELRNDSDQSLTFSLEGTQFVVAAHQIATVPTVASTIDLGGRTYFFDRTPVTSGDTNRFGERAGHRGATLTLFLSIDANGCLTVYQKDFTPRSEQPDDFPPCPKPQ